MNAHHPAPGPDGPGIDAVQQSRLVSAVAQTLAGTCGGEVVRIETHISIVLVAGTQACKFKKVLRTPFLDQSTLALRERACREELRLNRRLAPDLYLGVLPVTGTPAEPALGGAGPAIDWVVHMRAFDQDGLWDRQAARQALRPVQLDGLAASLVAFHEAAAAAPAGGWLGSPVQVRAPVLDSLADLAAAGLDAAWHDAVQALREWEARQFEQLAPVIVARQAAGRVREGHGDLHLGNVTTIEGRTTVFDGIEFNDDFRWIDVISDIAFLAMDLHAHGLPQLAHRFVNAWFEAGGDHDAVRLLDYHLVHRALVRARVAALRSTQCAAGTAEAAGHTTTARSYLDLALAFSQRRHLAAGPALLLTHGFSGSGKSTLTLGLVEEAGAVRIRADLERKRLADLQPTDRRGTQAGAALYSEAMTTATYTRLGALARPVLDSGRVAVLDATFLRRAQRNTARRLAAAQQVPCLILDFAAEPAVLRERLRARARQGGDASDADESVLAAQQQAAEPLQHDELDAVFRCVPAGQGADSPDLPPAVDWAPLLLRLAAARPATRDAQVAEVRPAPGFSSAAPPRR